jgi:hypothetical protein
MSDIFHHGTFREYEIGKVYVWSDENKQPTIRNENVESALERFRPDNTPKRTESFFATDKVEYASKFIEAERHRNPALENKPYRIYKVKLFDCHRSPMILVDKVRELIQSNGDMKTIAEEYWTPTRDWKFFEYFGPKMKVLGECSPPSEGAMMLVTVQCCKDSDLADKLFFGNT